MNFESTRFGALTLDPAKIIHFPLGLLGFETRQRYALIDSDEAEPMRWLQSLDEPDLAFLVVEPALFFPDYNARLTTEDRQVLDLDETSEPVVACLVVIPDDPSQMTINLMGPLVLNPEKRLGKQVVLHEAQYSARQRLLPDPASAEESAALV